MKTKIRKAIIPAAGLGVRFLPATKALPKEMMPIVDKSAIQYIIEEAVASGIEEILVITNSNKDSIENHFDRNYELEERLKETGKQDAYDMVRSIADMADIYFVRQKQPKGLGDAVLCAEAFVKDEPFALLLGDDIIVTEGEPALKQLVDFYQSNHQAPVVAVKTVADEEIGAFGIVEPETKVNPDQNYFMLSSVVEKPSLANAPSRKGIIGRYILTSDIFEILRAQDDKSDPLAINHLTEALVSLMDVRSVYAYEIDGALYDIEDNLTYVKAVVDFACQCEDLRDKVRAYVREVAARLE